jgi:tetratricopeptide (TPR) repeat protein
MGICYRRLENYDKALESYKKSLEIDPKGLMPLQNIAIVYQYKKNMSMLLKRIKK